MSAAPLISQRLKRVFAPVGIVTPLSVPPVLAPVNSPPISLSASPPITDAPDLALLEQVIAEAEQMVPQAVPTAMLQVAADAQAAQTAQLVSSAANSGNKERTVPGGLQTPEVSDQGLDQMVEAVQPPEIPLAPESSTSLLEGGQATTAASAEQAVETGQSVQYVEYEPNPELPPEVEGYLNRVEQHGDQAPKEIVIADPTQAMPLTHHLPAQPVVVVPITPEIEAVGAKKSPKFSIRWLVEWSHKIMKIFVGRVVYRQSEV